MHKYAQLDTTTNSVVGISWLYDEVNLDTLIPIDDSHIEPGSTYDPDTQTFIPPEPIEVKIDNSPSFEELAEETLLETKYQTALLEMMV